MRTREMPFTEEVSWLCSVSLNFSINHNSLYFSHAHTFFSVAYVTYPRTRFSCALLRSTVVFHFYFPVSLSMLSGWLAPFTVLFLRIVVRPHCHVINWSRYRPVTVRANRRRGFSFYRRIGILGRTHGQQGETRRGRDL